MRTTLLTCAILLALLLPAYGKVYKWSDRDGKVHFTDNISAVPPEYRNQVEERTGSPAAASPSSPAPAPEASAPVSYTIPLHKVGNALFVDVVLNDSLKARLLVDTGATDTVISQQLAQQLRLDPRDADIMPVSTANGVVLVPVTKVQSMSVGGATAHDVDVSVHDVGLPGGLLGMSFLDNFQVSINVTEGKMVLTTLAAVPGETPFRGRPEDWWRSRFRFYRQAIAGIETYLKDKKPAPPLRARLEKSLGFLQQKLAALERQATLAAVPRQWRY
jgi:clan AA aspartic protease (TIGR02281 family)